MIPGLTLRQEIRMNKIILIKEKPEFGIPAFCFLH